MKTITPEKLIAMGYTDDPEGLRRLNRPLVVPNTVFVIGLIGAMGGIASQTLPVVPAFWAAALCLGALLVIQIIACRSTPRSRFNGKPMKKYRSQTTDRYVLCEFIYVCEDSKTFFRRVWWMQSDF